MLGTGISCFVLALLASNDEQFDKIQTPLYLIGVVLQPAGILLAIEFFLAEIGVTPLWLQRGYDIATGHSVLAETFDCYLRYGSLAYRCTCYKRNLISLYLH